MIRFAGQPAALLRRPDPPRNPESGCRSWAALSTCPACLAEEPQKPGSRPGKAKSVILLYLLGGAATQDMFDLKPDAPVGDPRRSSSRSPPTSPASGSASICRAWPSWMHKSGRWSARSTTRPAATTPAQLHRLRGADRRHTITARHLSAEHGLGLRVSAARAGGDCPAYVYMPCYLGWGQAIRRAGPYAGFLGKRYDPLFTECDPYQADEVHRPAARSTRRSSRRAASCRTATWPTGITLDRLNTPRTAARADSTTAAASAETQPAHWTNYDRTQQRAFNLLTSSQAQGRRSTSTGPALRDRYGRTLFGQSTLIARRLVEAGVRFVNVTWDLLLGPRADRTTTPGTRTPATSPILQEDNLPHFDQTYSRPAGRPDEPRPAGRDAGGGDERDGPDAAINANGGRDHWTHCYAVMLAGAGIRGGTRLRRVRRPGGLRQGPAGQHRATSARRSTSAWASTRMTVHDRAGRPMPVAHGGRPIREILA